MILMKTNSAIEMTEPENYKKVDFHLYQQLLGKFMYLVYETRSDISFTIEQLSRHNTDVRKSHLQVVKRVVWYLDRIIKIGLIYNQKLNNQIPRGSSLIRLMRFADNSFAGDS